MASPLVAGLGSDPLEQVVDERVHDRHGLGRDAGVGMDRLNTCKAALQNDSKTKHSNGSTL